MTYLDQVFGSETVCDHLTWNHVIDLLQFCMLQITWSSISGTHQTETSRSLHRSNIRQRRSRSTDMHMWDQHSCSHIHRQINQTALDWERHTYIHTHQTAAGRLRAQVLWCVLQWPLILTSVTLEGSAVSTSPATHHDTAIMQYLAQHTHTYTRYTLMFRQILSKSYFVWPIHMNINFCTGSLEGLE